LKSRLAARDQAVEDLTAFRKLAWSRIAAQHDEIMYLRGQQPDPEPQLPTPLRAVPKNRTTAIGSCS
jgi:hypothetical protein